MAFFERDDIINAIPAALVAGEHILLVGSPGTAKSMLARAACQSIHGAKLFERLLTRFSTPDECLGPVSLSGLQQDRYERITTGKLPEAEVAFLDEIFKSNSALLNSLLSIMCERVWSNGNGQPTPVPLVTLFGASNEYPHDRAELGALFDRFLLKYEVKPIQAPDSFVGMLEMPDGLPTDVLPKVTIQELAEKREQAKSVEFDPRLFLELRQRLLEEGVTPSDRTWRKSVRLCQVVAHLRGAHTVEPADLELLSHCLWCDPSQQRTVRKQVGELANPMGARVVEIADISFELHRDALAKGDAEAGAEANAKLKQLTVELQSIRQKQSGVQLTKTDEVIARVQQQNKEVVQRCLGLQIS